MQRIVILGAPVGLVALQFWVAAGDVIKTRLGAAAGILAAFIVGIVLMGYMVGHSERTSLPFFAVPAFASTVLVVTLGALALRGPIADWPPGAQILALYLFSLFGTGIGLIIGSVLFLGVLWKN